MLVRRGLQRVAGKVGLRGFASQPSLDVAMPGMPELTPASAHAKPEAQVSTLDNGLRVVSEETYGQVTQMGVFVDAGSRYETYQNSGISHMLEHMAFKSTNKRSHLRLVRDVEDIGGHVVAVSAREFMIYQAEVLRENTETAMDILADTLTNSKLAPWDIDEQRKVIGYELEDMEQNAQSMLTELLLAAAYTDESPLGRPLWMPRRNLNKLTSDDLKGFMDEHFTANRMVFCAAGMDHSQAVDLAKKYFSDLPSGSAPAATPCKYVGGERRVQAESPLTHVTLCFDAAGGWKADNLMEVCTLHMLLGGGGSFSAGGPGKGMYSRLYTNVLNKHPWVDSATAYNQMYNEAGVLGIYGTAAPQSAGNLVEVMANEIIDVASKVPSAEETERAKNQLKSSVLMKLESRHVLFEELGRQVLTYGKHESAAAMCARIDQVTAEGIQAAAKQMISSPVSVASFGDVSNVPQYAAISSMFK